MTNGLFGNDISGYEFAIFSPAHWGALAVTVVVFMLFIVFRHQVRKIRLRETMRYSLIGLLVVCEAALHLWHVRSGSWDVRYSLPFELCNITLLLSIVMLVTRSYRLYEFVYFAGIGGALQALATPDLAFGFPHFRYWQFFIAHAAIILSCLFMTSAYGFRPVWRSIVRTIVWLNGIALVVFLFNLASGANYMFLIRKPSGGSLLDVLGPWPWYIVMMELVALAVFVLLYLPFVIERKMINNKKQV